MPMNGALVIFELVVMLLAISLHDCAQAWMANRLGDPTARMQGRISMNPVRHFDLFGTAIWPLLYIFRTPMVLGWGKPVPMTYRNFRQGNGELVATVAGPVAQLAAAVVCLIILIILKHTVPGTVASLGIVEMLALRAPIELPTLPGVFPLLLSALPLHPGQPAALRLQHPAHSVPRRRQDPRTLPALQRGQGLRAVRHLDHDRLLLRGLLRDHDDLRPRLRRLQRPPQHPLTRVPHLRHGLIVAKAARLWTRSPMYPETS